MRRLLALNTTRPPFKQRERCARPSTGRSTARRCVRLRGKFGGKRTDQILRSGRARVQGRQPLPAQGCEPGEGEGARRPATRGGNVDRLHLDAALAVQPSRRSSQFNLKQIGFDVDDQAVRPASSSYTKAGTKGEPFDIAVAGWCADYSDPFDFINVLLDGDSIQDANNINFAYFNNPAFNKLMDGGREAVGRRALRGVRRSSTSTS